MMKEKTIPVREVLHFLGWHGTPVEPELMEQIRGLCRKAEEALTPRKILRRFRVKDGFLQGTSFRLQGQDITNLLAPCGEAVLLAATLGKESEILLLREQAKDAVSTAILDAVLSAAIEAVCDEAENSLRTECRAAGLYLTDRFSPGYGDMPLEQCRTICEILNAGKTIGLTVSENGIMIPRKSVTAVMGISPVQVQRRPSGCAVCPSRETCTFRRNEAERTEENEP